MKVYSVLWHSLRCVGGCLQTNFGADNVVVMLVGEGGGGHDVRILMPHANVVCKLPCLALLYVCCTANLDFICPQLFEKATASCPFSCWFWTYFIVWRAAPGKFCEFWCCEMASESWHGTRILIHFKSARTEISVHRRFQAAWERREGATHASWLEFCLVFCLIVIQARTCGRRAQNLLVLRSPQLSFTSGPWHSCGHEWICTDDTRTSRLKANGRRSYLTLSQNIGPAVAGSPGPAPPPLHHEWNNTITIMQDTIEYTPKVSLALSGTFAIVRVISSTVYIIFKVTSHPFCAL